MNTKDKLLTERAFIYDETLKQWISCQYVFPATFEKRLVEELSYESLKELLDIYALGYGPSLWEERFDEATEKGLIPIYSDGMTRQ